MQRMGSSALSACVVIGLSVVGFGLTSKPVGAQATPKRYDNAEARQFLSQAEQVAAKVTDKALQVKVLEEIGAGKAATGDFEGARVVALSLEKDESKADVLEEIALTQALAGDSDEAIKTIDGIKPLGLKIISYSMVSEALLQKGRKAEALRLIEKTLAPLSLLKQPPLPQSPQPSEEQIQNETYYDVAGLISGAGFAKAGNPLKSSQIADQFQGNSLRDEVNTALHAIAKAWNHDIKGALSKASELNSGFPATIVLLSITDAYYKAGDKAGAQTYCRRMRSLVASDADWIETLMKIATLQHENKDDAAAADTIDLAVRLDARRKIAGESGKIAVTQASLGKIEEALKLLAKIPKPEDQVETRQAIAAAKAQRGDVSGALAMAPADASPFCQAKVRIGVARGILESLKKPAKP